MKTGLFFGSFNPIHNGHLALAGYMLENTNLHELWFVVSPHNPLKDKHLLLPDEQRLHMVQLAIETDTRFRACDVELSLPRPSYTIDTIRHLEKLYPEKEFIIIMGSDGLPTFHQWKDHQILETRYMRYVYPRPGFEIDPNTPNILRVNAPLMNISSTNIRQAIAEKQPDVAHLLPDKVWNYIVSQHLFFK